MYLLINDMFWERIHKIWCSHITVNENYDLDNFTKVRRKMKNNKSTFMNTLFHEEIIFISTLLTPIYFQNHSYVF